MSNKKHNLTTIVVFLSELLMIFYLHKRKQKNKFDLQFYFSLIFTNGGESADNYLMQMKLYASTAIRK